MKLIKQGLVLMGLTTLLTGLANPSRADILGRVIVGGVTNQALTEVTQKDCPDATGLGETACGAADAVVDVHHDISDAANQQVQQSCENASGAGEDVCQGVSDVGSFKKQLSEQVNHLLFGGHHQDAQEPTPAQSPTPDANPTQNTPANSSNAPSGSNAP